ncbi:hypothetical protein FY145_06925 [Agrobacterium tumefaciens]|uniref:Phage protein Gp138 N-terminal domain-containing protein n=1 Tax=Agrobacterium tumefaciens TaxID=358 RepID=A0AAP9J5V9_AGRTU|nr:Gp138 family membrane-puncturing spike protein [Agrobacterium tumefaciens]NSZ57762.1 hypothetical protein [Agrobacterium tumefaciens]QDY93881.1 hypothetical protein CG010_006925 [Agrobacterium tumefaciens]UXS48953.1 hypothetical protein FY149_17040 [Agrobacterium tumefaciens]UXS70257.1 hypothetical protein FY146_06925 [Agrobacterium tumefaciens]UXS77920.1 hypothetical protein FY145_06925 [Agrobacterium tumefaciens]
MAGYLGKTTNDPRDVTDRQAESEREAQWGPIPGEIVSYNGQTATVKPLYKPIHNGKAVDMPVLLEVPVDLPRTANAGITFPIPVGTRVMLAPMMRSMDNYDVDDDGTPSDARSFSLSDMRATIVGGDSLKSPLENVDLQNTHIRFSADGSFGMKGSPDGKFQLMGAEGDVLDVLAQVCELLAVLTTTVSSGSSTGVWPITQQAALGALATKLRAMVL